MDRVLLCPACCSVHYPANEARPPRRCPHCGDKHLLGWSETLSCLYCGEAVTPEAWESLIRSVQAAPEGASAHAACEACQDSMTENALELQLQEQASERFWQSRRFLIVSLVTMLAGSLLLSYLLS